MNAPTVVIVAYGAETMLAACLAGLEAAATRVLVVDNAGRAATRDVVERHQATYVDAGGNLGFAGGVNVGLGLADPRSDVLLLNPDARLAPADLDRLADALEGAAADVAAVAPAQRHPDTGAAQRVAWPFPTPGRQWLVALGLGRLVRGSDFLIGSALLLRRAALDDVGPFDERFFLYCEETDWQRRAHDRGWRVQLVADVTALHVGAGTSDDSTRREAFFHAGHELYVRKWFGPRGWRSYRLACLVGDLVRARTGGERARAARARLAIYREGPVRHRDRLLAGPGA